jgi:hypothetical protein
MRLVKNIHFKHIGLHPMLLEVYLKIPRLSKLYSFFTKNL